MEILPSTASCFYLSKKVTGGDWWVERQFRRCRLLEIGWLFDKERRLMNKEVMDEMAQNTVNL